MGDGANNDRSSWDVLMNGPKTVEEAWTPTKYVIPLGLLFAILTLVYSDMVANMMVGIGLGGLFVLHETKQKSSSWSEDFTAKGFVYINQFMIVDAAFMVFLSTGLVQAPGLEWWVVGNVLASTSLAAIIAHAGYLIRMNNDGLTKEPSPIV